jgi:hypothetical protein
MAESRPYVFVSSLRDEDQDHRNDERQQAEKFGSGEADEQAALLAVSGSWVAQCALKERTEHVAHAACGETRTNGGKTGTDQLCSFCVHDKLPLKNQSLVVVRKLSAN